MGILKVLLFFVLIILNLNASIDVSTIKTGTLLKEIEYFEDPTHKKTIKEVIVHKEWKKFVKSNLGDSRSSFWVKTSLTNLSQQTHNFILKNPRTRIDKVDVYIIKNGEIKKVINLGGMRSLDENAIPDRYSSIDLTINPHESIDVFSKVKTTGTIEIGWMFHNTEDYVYRTLKENIFWGIFTGIIFTLIIYNFSLWISLRYKFFLVYSLLGVNVLFIQSIINGIFKLGFSDTFLEFINHYVHLFFGLNFLFFIFFAMVFFNTKKSMKTLHTISLIVIGAVTLGIILLYLMDFDARIFLFLRLATLFVFILLFTIGIRAIILKKVGANYYLMGQIFLVFSYVFLTLSNMFPSNFRNEYLYIIIPLGSILDMGFLSLAQSVYIKSIDEEKERFKLAALSQSRFTSIGKSLGNIIHQWHTPIVRMGSSLTELESEILFYKKESFLERVKEISKQLRNNIKYVEEITSEFGRFYQSKAKDEEFLISNIIEDILDLLNNKISKRDIIITKEFSYLEKILGQKIALSQSLLIIIDNAIEIFQLREVEKGIITISVAEKKQSIEISIRDNGGGIKATPIDSIFQGFVSEKSESNFGIGLMISKTLIEEKLDGKISAHNINNGAEFIVSLPKANHNKILSQ